MVVVVMVLAARHKLLCVPALFMLLCVASAVVHAALQALLFTLVAVDNGCVAGAY